MLRIGCVPYLNAKPLIEGLEGIVFRPPARLAALLERGAADAALLPSLEVLRRELAWVPGVAIASPGPADSVRLHLRKPLDRVRTVQLDPASRSTNALARIVLQRRHGIRPRCVRAGAADAFVTIGDASFRDRGCPSLDLAEEWKLLTGLPFVFALWAHDPSHPRAEEIRRTLRAAKAEGLESLGDIVEREHARVGIDRDRCRRYLTRCITYDLGPEERKGLRLFEKLAKELGLFGRERVLQA